MGKEGKGIKYRTSALNERVSENSSEATSGWELPDKIAVKVSPGWKKKVQVPVPFVCDFVTWILVE